MRALVLFFAFAVAVLRGSDDFGEALRAYEAGDYAEARRGFERVIARNPTVAAFYNLGNAHFRLGAHGPAALAYERVLALEPGHADAASNLAFVREKARAKIPVADWRERALGTINLHAAPWLALGVAWVGWLAAAAGAGMRRGVLVAAGVLAAMAGGALLFGAMWKCDRAARLALVVVPEVEARTQPADRAAAMLALPPGSRVRVLSEHGEWTYCELPEGGAGWLKAGVIERVLPQVVR